MPEQQDLWSGRIPPPPGWLPPPAVPPSMSFSPQRPVYREPHPVRVAGVVSGLGAAVVWLTVIGLLARDLRAYAWFTLLGGLVAWTVSALLVRLGDRGVAVGIAVGTAVGWAVAAGAVAVRWTVTGDWPMW